MKKEFDLNYSNEALLSRVLFLASSTELNIFVEDDGKEYEYEEIFERLLPDGIHINIIFIRQSIFIYKIRCSFVYIFYS